MLVDTLQAAESGLSPAAIAGLIAAGAALVGALGSQLIAGMLGLRAKRMDLYFRAKSEAYNRVMDAVGEFALSPADQDAYLKFLAACDGALLFASDEVVQAMNGPTGINVNAGRMRQSAAGGADVVPLVRVQATTWKDAVDVLTAVMRADLRSTGGAK